MTKTMRSDALHRSARNTLGRLARAQMDNDVFRWEAAEVLQRAIGFDTWCWVLLDPATGLFTRYTVTNPVIGHAPRRFFPLDLQSSTTGPPPGLPRPPDVSVLSAATGGALDRDPRWREMLGPGGLGDQLCARLAADGVGWAYLTLYRDEDRAWFNPGDAAFIAGVAPLLAARLRAGLRQTIPAGTDPGEPGTIVVDGDLTLVTATSQAWRWIARLGLATPSDADPLPGFIYAMLARLIHTAEPDQTAQVCLQAADGTWVLVRAASLTGPHVDGGYAITLQSAPPADLTSVLMPAWNLTSRERDVAAGIIEGRPSDDIARSLFLSPHTVRDHTKAIFGKVGVHNRRHLTAALTGQPAAA
jgi:DNA-binding CsgD family transcriptional regulator